MSKQFMPFDEVIRSIIKEGDKINLDALYPDDEKKQYYILMKLDMVRNRL